MLLLTFLILAGLFFIWSDWSPSEHQAEKEEHSKQYPAHPVRINEDTLKKAVGNPNADPSADPNIYTCENDDNCVLVSVMK